MAVRNDFTAGEVLAAADLNDTFASKLPYSYGTATPSTTDSGFLWYDSNSAPPVPKYWNGSSFATLAPAPGLELIDADTLSGSSIIIDGCFSATYENYRVMVRGLSASGTPNLKYRLRVGGSSDSTSNYHTQFLSAESTSVTGIRFSGETSGRVGPVFDTTRDNVQAFDVFSPNETRPTTFVGQGFYSSSTANIAWYCSQHNVATSYTGIELFPSSSTITGQYFIYGYKTS